MRSFRLGSQAARAEARRPTAPVDSGVALAIRVTPARIGRRAPRLALLSGTMFAGVALVTALASPTLADGGKGGDAFSFANSGGAGGVTSATGGGATANGGNAVPSRGGGGGGGGAGVTGGAGGFGTQSGGIGTVSGGNGATTAGGSGVAGTNAVDVGCSPCGGGGGGGGAHGAMITTSTTNSSPLSGGNGGAGGNANVGGGGGGGGAGGYGTVVDGGGLSYINNSSIAGGVGGAGGTGVSGGSVGGNGGAGGIGVQFTTGGTLRNLGTITGGNGGARGIGTFLASDGTAGLGGVGVSGADLIVVNSGTITGGLHGLGSGSPQADAITFTGGTNRLELRAGYIINGNVTAFSTADTLRLGGGTDSTFDVSQIGGTQQYRGFGVFEKTGTSTWTLLNTTTELTPWTIRNGALAISQNAALGSDAGAVTLDGGTLQFLAGFNLSHNVTVGAIGGALDPNGNDVTMSGTITGVGTLGIGLNGGTLTLTSTGNAIDGDLMISTCGCTPGGLTINGGSFSVGGATLVDAGTLAVVNGGTLLTTELGVADTAIISGAGSSVTVTGQTFVGNFAPGTLTISNGATLNSQGGAIIAFFPLPGDTGLPTVTVTGPGSTWNVDTGLAVGDDSFGGPGSLVIANGGVVNSSGTTFVGSDPVFGGTSTVMVTGPGSTLNALGPLAIGADFGCGCSTLLGTLTVADGGVVNAPLRDHDRRRQHAQSRHRWTSRRDQHADDRQRRPDRRQLYRHAHPGRRHCRHRHVEQGRRGHADAHRQQQLHRRHHGQRRHAVGERLDRQFRPHRQCRRHHRRQRQIGNTTINGARFRPATRSARSPCRATWCSPRPRPTSSRSRPRLPTAPTSRVPRRWAAPCRRSSRRRPISRAPTPSCRRRAEAPARSAT